MVRLEKRTAKVATFQNKDKPKQDFLVPIRHKVTRVPSDYPIKVGQKPDSYRRV